MTDALIEIDNLVVDIRSMTALRGFSMRIDKGAMVSLVGRNGAGKTTLIRSIMGHLRPAQGSVRFEGADLSAQPRHRRHWSWPSDRKRNCRYPRWNS